MNHCKISIKPNKDTLVNLFWYCLAKYFSWDLYHLRLWFDFNQSLKNKTLDVNFFTLQRSNPEFYFAGVIIGRIQVLVDLFPQSRLRLSCVGHARLAQGVGSERGSDVFPESFTPGSNNEYEQFVLNWSME